ncbi:hypothetical protein IEQ34_002649 [Dendrobium chrysotoxum]|uniref:Uncharacterized protein n=1 Tax=Dendrobium chrysotoxum TaxID=161865 RepID=A0AAV7HGC0_DENCH|nr:hypothetical protein IEQ34_002649 [Dendrobium chrysotoxum]
MKFYFLNDHVMKVPKNSDRVCSLPSGFLIVYEFNLQAGLRYAKEEYLFKVGRSHALVLKISTKIQEAPADTSRAPPKICENDGDLQASSKKKKMEEILTGNSKSYNSSPSKLNILEDILKHQCVGRRQANDLLLQYMDLEIDLIQALNDWNKEFMKVKYLQGEYIRKYDDKFREMKADPVHIKLVDAQTIINQHVKDQQILEEKITALEDGNKRFQNLLYEKEVALSKAKSKLELSFPKEFVWCSARLELNLRGWHLARLLMILLQIKMVTRLKLLIFPLNGTSLISSRDRHLEIALSGPLTNIGRPLTDLHSHKPSGLPEPAGGEVPTNGKKMQQHAMRTPGGPGLTS